MYKYLIRFLSALLVLILLCGTVQATNLLITVQDGLDNTTISQATVYQDGVNVGRTTSVGTYMIVHDGSEALDIRVTKTGYEDWEKTVGANVTALLVNMTRQTLVLKVKLYDSDSFDMISGAKVGLTTNNVTDIKTSDSNGLVTFPVTANTIYDIAISAPYYQSQVPRAIEIGTENKEVQYWLMRNDRFSVIVTDPDKNPIQNAEVSLDSVVKGKTDARGFLILQVERDKPYVIEVKKDGYESYIEKKTIAADEALIMVQISKVPIGAFVSVYDENHLPVEGASVYLDSTLAGTTDKYGKYVMGTITAGSYQLEVKKQGYVAKKESITISKQGDEFTIDLPYDQADLTVFVQDKDQKVVPGATVYVNGNNAGLTGDNGQVTAKVKYNMVSNITATKDGYQTAKAEHTIIIGNATGSVTVMMERNLDWGFILLVVAGAVVVILLFALIRHMSKKPGRHVVRRNEI